VTLQGSWEKNEGHIFFFRKKLRGKIKKFRKRKRRKKNKIVLG